MKLALDDILARCNREFSSEDCIRKAESMIISAYNLGRESRVREIAEQIKKLVEKDTSGFLKSVLETTNYL